MAMVRMKFPPGATCAAGELDADNCIEVMEESVSEWERQGAVRADVAAPPKDEPEAKKPRRRKDKPRKKGRRG
jgi:hypothetical protein